MLASWRPLQSLSHVGLSASVLTAVEQHLLLGAELRSAALPAHHNFASFAAAPAAGCRFSNSKASSVAPAAAQSTFVHSTAGSQLRRLQTSSQAPGSAAEHTISPAAQVPDQVRKHLLRRPANFSSVTAHCQQTESSEREISRYGRALGDVTGKRQS